MPYDDGIVWVYLITNSNNGKRYVGVTSSSVDERWQQHVQASQHESSRPFMCAIKKHGVDAFVLTTLEECSNREMLCARERHWIAELGTFIPHGYNATLGGEGLAGHKHTVETRTRMSASRRGERNPNWGGLSEAHRKKISESRKGKCQGNKGSRGHLRSQDAKTRSARAHWKKVMQCSMLGEVLRTYDSMLEATTVTGIGGQGISRACRFPRRSAGGFRWRYADDVEQEQ